MSDLSCAVELSEVGFSYGEHLALNSVSLKIKPAEIFVFLGPNGGGKTTLFRLLSTLVPMQSGSASVLGYDLQRESFPIRKRIGVVFQAPSLDKKLTVEENLNYQAALYGLAGVESAKRQDTLLAQLQITDRRKDKIEKLSGGLRRRVELAKGMLHQPALLLLDEPSTGLDPGVRADLWAYLHYLKEQHSVTIVLTTHLLEEADRADRIAILSKGELVALGAPDTLKASVGGASIMIESHDPRTVKQILADRLQLASTIMEQDVRLEHADGHQLVPKIMEALGDHVRAIRVGKPTLEDVFIDKTGHRFVNPELDGEGE